jgi:hypothetical protein
METCACERCAFESEHLAGVFRDSGVDGIVELVKKHNYRKSYCEFVLLVWFLMNKTDHRTVTLASWSAILSKIEKAASFHSLPLRTYWAILAVQSITTVCNEAYTSPFVHGLLTQELAKYTGGAVKKSIELDVDIFEEAVISTIDFLVSYVYVWHPSADELIEGLDASNFPSRRMTPRQDLFDRTFAYAVVVFLHTLITDVTFSSTSSVYTEQLLFLLRAVRHDIVSNAASNFRDPIVGSDIFGAMYHIAFDPACEPIESTFNPHRLVLCDIVIALTTGSREIFMLVAKNENSEFLATKSFVIMTKLTRGISAITNIRDVHRIFREIENLRKKQRVEPESESDEPEPDSTTTVVEDPTALDRLIEEFEEEDRASDARRRKKRERKRERKARKRAAAAPTPPPRTPTAAAADVPTEPDAFALPAWNPVDDDVHRLVLKNPWVVQ